MTPNSLAVRLVAGAAVWSTAALLVGGFVLSMLFRDYVERSFDDRLLVHLESLVAASEIKPDEPEHGGLVLVQPAGEPRFERPYSGWYWQVSGPEGAVLRSRSLWDQEMTPATGPVRQGVQRAKMAGPDGESLRVVSRRIRLADSDTDLIFSVGGDLSEVVGEIDSFNNTLIWALGLMVAGLLAAMLIQVHFGLLPLRRMRTALANIRTGRTDRLAGNYPSEIKPLADELDALLDQNEAVVERARTHVGNLAHALKTPLSVLTNEAKAGDGPLADLVDRQAALMRRQVDHYLVRARTAAATRVLGQRADVGSVIDDLTRTLQKIHADRSIAVDTVCPVGLTFRGERQDLEEMVGNLLDNGCKWARTRVRITAAGDGQQFSVTIDDDGPGLAEDRREQVLERGARLDESVPGSGLGLAIVRDIARLYGGDIGLDRSDLGGLRAELTLPAASET
ncbi:MAG: HAMP domain-containing histidine kinase [Minwuiales bacterium]|nr:HAMP domain-containing histidine kinase [Minwuiales bacterium]